MNWCVIFRVFYSFKKKITNKGTLQIGTLEVEEYKEVQTPNPKDKFGSRIILDTSRFRGNCLEA